MQQTANEFLQLLNNREKQRTTCLLSLLEGRIDDEIVTDLQPAQDWCFDSDQTWNSCYTVRYRADGKGALFGPLIRQFAEDVAATIDFLKKAPGESVGSIRKADGQDWMRFEESLLRFDTSPKVPDSELVRGFASMLQDTLETGRRLVIFCEVENSPTLETLGLDPSSTNALLEILPERFALVLAGVDVSLGSKAADEGFYRIDCGEDYLATSPPEDRSQPLASDTARGDDSLNIEGEINALADAIAARDLQPPLVLGVLGGWGAGKSFVLHLLEERLLAIRRKNILDEGVRASYPYVGHFYMVRFDAWTYAKADLWSSLMQEVLLALNDQIAYEQLGVERAAGDKETLKRLRATEKVLGESEAFDKEKARKYVKQLPTKDRPAPDPEALTADYLGSKRELFDKMFATLLSGEDGFSPDVVEALNRDDSDTRQLLDRLDNDILWSRLQGLNKRLQQELTREESNLRAARLQLAESEARLGEKVDLNLRKDHWQTFSSRLAGRLGASFREAVDKQQKEAGEEKRIPFDQAIESVGVLRKVAAGRSLRTLAVFLGFLLAGGVVAAFAKEVAALWVAASGLFGGTLAGVVESWSRANAWMKGQVEAFDAFDVEVRAKQEERREALMAKEKSLKDFKGKALKVAELESKVEAYRRKIGLTAGHPTLLDFIANRLEEGGYAERLGLLHQVQQDIRQLTDGLLSKALCVSDGKVGRATELENVLFPRGDPRVVLFIDDLDRCPPARVVEVLEAAQLLVKTQLFVVVLAMDVRYITKALEKAYEGVLDRRGAPSGLDYIEKIVQVPYRIRPISAEAMPGYLRSQMAVREESPTTAEPLETDAKLTGDGELSFISAPGEGTVRIDETIPQSILEFDLEELELIQTCALAATIGPRATKRLVNVMKLIKIIWYRTGYDDVSLETRKTVVFFLTLSARYAEVMRRVLLEMESIVVKPGGRGFRLKLPALLARIAKDWGSVEGRRSEWQFLKSAANNPALLPPAMTLERLGVRNIELIRSFSFVGEVDLPPDPGTHQVTLELREPVKIAREPPPES